MRFGVLGPVTAEVDGREIPLRAPLVRSLLGLLLLEAGRPVPESRIVRILWNGEPPRTAKASLHNHVLRLRRTLDDPDARIVQRTADGYLLAIGAAGLDLTEFDALRLHGTEALNAGRWSEAENLLSEALALWRDVPLADVPAAIRDAIGLERIYEAGIQTRELLARSRLRSGSFSQAVADLGPLIREHPWRETLSGLMMEALYGAGRQADALRVYRDLRARLNEELGVEPSVGIRELFQQILRYEPVAPPAPPARPPAAVPAQLPADLADFSGRSSVADELFRSLSQPYSPHAEPRPLVVVAITGVGGVGKTSLAVHVAHRLASHFPDGQLFAGLAGASSAPRSPADVLDELLVGLGMPEHTVPTGFAARAAEFRSLTSGRRVLLVLDDAADAAQVRPLLPGSGSCGVVVTGRSRLTGLAGAVPLDLDVLDPAEARDLFTAIVGGDRAEAEPQARDEVLGYCAGLPLAIRIAASRLAARPSWTVASLADRLADERDRLDELSVEDVAVRASFHVSYLNLGDSDLPVSDSRARAFRLLGLWPSGDLPLPAVAALFGTTPGQAGRLLEALTDAHLLDSRTADRYRLHELLRIYSRELAETEDPPEETAAAVARLIAWYTHTAAAAADLFVPDRIRYGLDLVPAGAPTPTFPDRAAALDWFRGERTNLKTAVALAAGAGHVAGWVLPAQLMQVYDQCSLWLDLEETHTAGLRTAERLNDPLGQSRMHTGLMAAFGHLGRYDEGLEAGRLAHEQAAATDDPALAAIAMSTYAAALNSAGHHDEALAWHAKALLAARAVGNLVLLADSLVNAGDCHLLGESFTEAADAFGEALTAAREAGARYQEALALRGLGESEYRLGDSTAAVATLRKAAELAETIGDPPGRARCHDRLGDALLTAGQPDEACDAWREALRWWGETGGAEADAVWVKLARVEPFRVASRAFISGRPAR